MKYFWIVVLALLSLMSCGKSDSPAETKSISLISVSVNGTPLLNGATNIPLDAVIEMTFSSEISPAKFENLFSLRQGSSGANYSVAYTNATSKAIITPEVLVADVQYDLNLSTGVLGSDGSSLSSGVSISFITSNTKIPCISGSDSCIQTMDITAESGSTFQFDMYSNFDFIDDSNYEFSDIDRLIIVVHGANRNADDYFTFMTSAIQSQDMETSTLLIAPNFKDNGTASGNDLYWGTGWREGTNSGNPNSAVSSFEVVDKIIEQVMNSGQFPNLSRVLITGHSSGGAFTQHYALANKSENNYSSMAFDYVVANNQYFYYPDGLRYNETTQQFETPTSCNGYTYWPYGYEFSVSYLDGITQSVITEQQVTRHTIYLIGSNDTSTTGTLNTTDCQATLLGSNRVKRNDHMYLFMQTYYPDTNNHEKIVVPNVGHDAQGMYNSAVFKQYLSSIK